MSEELQKPPPLLVSKKVLLYASNLYGSTPPICITVPSWLLMKKGKPNNTPPICTAVRLPFVRQYASQLYGSTFEKVLGVWGHRKVLEFVAPSRVGFFHGVHLQAIACHVLHGAHKTTLNPGRRVAMVNPWKSLLVLGWNWVDKKFDFVCVWG